MSAEVTQIQSRRRFCEQKLNFVLAGFNFQSDKCNFSGQDDSGLIARGKLILLLGK